MMYQLTYTIQINKGNRIGESQISVRLRYGIIHAFIKLNKKFNLCPTTESTFQAVPMPLN